ncbi:hypothetical protein BH10ACI2_BH10ACI2_14630 [soil metagenome]
MPTQINQIFDTDRGITILRVDGDMLRDDAILIERLVSNLLDESGDDVILDLADLDLIDSEAAPILRRMSDVKGFSIEGMEIFLQSVVNSVEGHHVGIDLA